MREQKKFFLVTLGQFILSYPSPQHLLHQVRTLSWLIRSLWVLGKLPDALHGRSQISATVHLFSCCLPDCGGGLFVSSYLLVDLTGMKLVHSSEQWSMPLSAPPSSGTFATIGVQLMAPSPSMRTGGPQRSRQGIGEGGAVLFGGGSPGSQRGPTSWKVTPHRSPVEPAPIFSKPQWQVPRPLRPRSSRHLWQVAGAAVPHV